MLHHHALEIDQRENQGIVILDLDGKLEMGRGDIALREFAESVLKQGKRQVILNMARVSEIDTAGNGVLLILAQEYRDAGGRLALLKVDRVHAAVYEMARLETVIQIYDAEVDAVNSFFPDRAAPRYDILEFVEHLQHEEQNDQK
ncbi:MAG TPA: STAS domain-containing protein [Bryobacteraceae bacterium]|nr:STAS domain-containing protein [Bryobacteraceae bacterium]